MKKIFFIFIFTLMAFSLFAYPWGHRYATVQSWADTTICVGNTLTFSVEWGEGDWTHSDLGYGTSQDGTGWTWVDIPWFEDGSGSNKRCKTDVTFNTVGDYYYSYRMEKPAGTYSYQDGNDAWSENSANLSPIHKVTVQTCPLPVTLSQFNANMVNGVSVLNWVTSSEQNNEGWNIYRSISENFGQATKINNELIPGAGNTTQTTSYTYKDNFEPTAGTYYYWLESIELSGNTHLYEPIELVVNNNEQPNAPTNVYKYGLQKNYPNPFNPSTQISFILSHNSYVTLEIYNVKGQKVKILLNNNFVQKDFMQRVTWNGTDERGKTLSSGIYFYKLITDKKIEIKRMVLLK